MSPDEKLIYMANQIAGFFRAQGHDRAVAGIADHIQRFWEPHMRRRYAQLAPAHKAEVDPLVAEAFTRVKVPEPE
jgi:formate dehydrogenase subunit delta